MADKQQFEQKVCCPYCRSTQIQSKTAGFSIVKAAVGAVLVGPVGLLGGTHGANKVRLYCLKCGREWSLDKQVRFNNQKSYDELTQSEKDMGNFLGICFVAAIIFVICIIIFASCSGGK